MTKNQRIKTVQFAVGVDLLGSKMTLTAQRGTELELTGVGVMAHSRSTGRTVLIPFSNIKGLELLPEEKETKAK